MLSICSIVPSIHDTLPIWKTFPKSQGMNCSLHTFQSVHSVAKNTTSRWQQGVISWGLCGPSCHTNVLLLLLLLHRPGPPHRDPVRCSSADCLALNFHRLDVSLQVPFKLFLKNVARLPHWPLLEAGSPSAIHAAVRRFWFGQVARGFHGLLGRDWESVYLFADYISALPFQGLF